MKQLGLIFGVLISTQAFAQRVTRIESFTPTGDVHGEVQVHIQFSDFMFRLGEMPETHPVKSNCDGYGTGSWLNPKEWTFNFKKPIPAKTECVYDLDPTLQSVSGIPVVGPNRYSFKTAPARLANVEPFGESSAPSLSYWGKNSMGIDPDQQFLLHFKDKITPEEIQKRFFFSFDGHSGAVGFKIASESELKTLLEKKRVYWDQKEGATVLLKPDLEFPDNGFALVELHDREGEAYYYRTRPFLEAQFSCNRDNANAPCSPVQRVEVNFNSEIEVEVLKKIRAIPSSGKGEPVAVDEKAYEGYSYARTAAFKGPFRAGVSYRIEIPSKFTDIRGRSLSNADKFPLTVNFDSLPRVAKFPGHFGLIEAANPVLPISIRNVEKTLQVKDAVIRDFTTPETGFDLLRWLKRIRAQDERSYGERNPPFDGAAVDYESVFSHFKKEIQGKVESKSLPSMNESNQAEVVGIPLSKKGLHIVEYQSKILGKAILDRETPLFTSTAVLVTDLAVHYKKSGDGQSLVWVTSLSEGKPVADVNLSLLDCHGGVRATGKSKADGTWLISTEDSRAVKNNHCDWNESLGAHSLIMAKKGDDFSFTLDSFKTGIESWRFNLDHFWGRKSRPSHTVFARDLLKPGQKVFMKHYFREFHWEGFGVPKVLPDTVVIRHDGGGRGSMSEGDGEGEDGLGENENTANDEWKLPVQFDALGIATTEWTIPENAHLGFYSVTLKRGEDTLSHNGGFEVQEFRLPVVNVGFKAPDPITAETRNPKLAIQGTFLSGGPTSNLGVELRFLRKVTPDVRRGFGEWVFGQNAPVKAGVIDQDQRGDAEDLGAWTEEGEGGASERSRSSRKADMVLNSNLVKKLNLDSMGSAYVEFPTEVLNADQDAEVQVAMNYTDPNGEIQTFMRSISVLSRDRYLGVSSRLGYSFDDPKEIKFPIHLAQGNGKAVSGGKIRVNLYRETQFTHRIKLTGGFYGYHRTTEIKREGELCKSGETDSKGEFLCLGQVSEPGRYIAEIVSEDSKGRDLYYRHDFTVYGKSEDAADYSENDRLTLVPLKSEFNLGEDAVIGVKSSFKEAEALVTLEREGVMEFFTTHLSGEKPEIRFPVKKEYSPNLVVSVMLVRPRVAAPEPTGLLDLAKPAFKLGMVNLKFGIDAHRLPLTMKTDLPVYQVRSKMKVSIETKPRAEVALMVVDQALLKLKANETVNLLDEMMISQGHGVETATNQINLIGKRHFGKKATPFGGGGGKLMPRELLDSLVAWKPRLKADATGKIEAEIKLNDSISSFAVIAVGSEGLDYYGTAKTEVATTQDLQILSSVPPTLRENDDLPLQFLLRNTTLETLHVTANLTVGKESQRSQEVEVAPQSTQEVSWKVHVPFNVSTLPLLMSVTSKEGASDSLKIAPKVVELVPVTVREGYLEQLSSSPAVLPVGFPKEALVGKGGYRVQVQSRLSEVPESVTRYFKYYPFSCLEQRTSIAIGLQDEKAFQGIVKDLKIYRDSNGMLKYFPGTRFGSIDLTAYFALMAKEASVLNSKFQLPHDEAEKLTVALKEAMRGRIHISEPWWPQYVASNERIAAGEALSLYEAIEAPDYESLKSVRDRSKLSHALSLVAILKNSGKTLSKFSGDLKEYQNEILAHFRFENTHLNLLDTGFWFFGGLRDTPNGLMARTLQKFVGEGEKETATKLLRSLMEVAKTSAYDTTSGNALAVLALHGFGEKYEKDPVNGELKLTVGSVEKKLKMNEKTKRASTLISVKDLPATEGKRDLKESYTGTGKPWAFTMVEAAVPLKSPLDRGYSIVKTVKSELQAKSGQNTRGDVYEVSLKIEAKAPQTWVAVSDPIPTGASILSTESGAGWIAFEERRMDRMNVFFEYLPKGTIEFKYKVRLNQSGAFGLPTTRIEAMYDPTQFGEFPNAEMKIEP